MKLCVFFVITPEQTFDLITNSKIVQFHPHSEQKQPHAILNLHFYWGSRIGLPGLNSRKLHINWLLAHRWRCMLLLSPPTQNVISQSLLVVEEKIMVWLQFVFIFTCMMLVLPTAGAPSRMTLTRSTDSGLISIGLCCDAPSPLLFEVEPAFWRRSRKSRSNSVIEENPITPWHELSILVGVGVGIQVWNPQ